MVDYKSVSSETKCNLTAGPVSSDRQSYRGSDRTSAVSTSSQPKPRKTLTYAEQLQSLQKPKDEYYNKPSMTCYCIIHQF